MGEGGDAGGGRLDVEGYLRAVGRRIRILRLTRELTQEELAAATGMSRNFVSLVEQGANGVDVVRLLRIAVALEVPIEELLRMP